MLSSQNTGLYGAALLLALCPLYWSSLAEASADTAQRSSPGALSPAPTAEPEAQDRVLLRRLREKNPQLLECLREKLSQDRPYQPVSIRFARGGVDAVQPSLISACFDRGPYELPGPEGATMIAYLDHRRGVRMLFFGTQAEWSQCRSFTKQQNRRCPSGAEWVGGRFGSSEGCELPDGTWHGYYKSDMGHGMYCRGVEHGLEVSEIKGERSRGHYFLGLRHGWFEELYDNGKVAKRATYRYGALDGKQTSYYWNGRKASEGLARDGRRHGAWRFWYPDGSAEASGRFDLGTPHGLWHFWDLTGERQELSFAPGAKSSFCPAAAELQIEYLRSSTVYACVLSDAALKHGPYMEWWLWGGRNVQGGYNKGVKHGTWRHWVGETQLDVEQFVDGKMHGARERWLYGQRDVSTPYQNGQKNGASRSWHLDGKLESEVSYKDDKLHGPISAFFQDGSKKNLGQFEDGKRQGTWTGWFQGGKLRRMGHYDKNRRTGKWQYWHEEGKLIAEGEYRDDNKHGPWRYWHLNGQIWVQEVCDEGELVGESKAWTEDGASDRTATERVRKEIHWSPCTEMPGLEAGYSGASDHFLQDF